MFLKKIVNSMRTLAFRLTLWYTASFLVSSVLVFLISYLMIASALKERADLELSIEFKELESLYQLKGIDAVKEAIFIEAKSEGTENMFLRLVEGSGVESVFPDLSTWGNAALGTDLVKQVAEGRESVFETLPVPNQQHHVRTLTASLEGGQILQIGRSTEKDEHLLKTCRDTIVISAFLILALGAMVGFLMAKGSLRGLVTITRAVDGISEGNLDRRVTVAGWGNEIETLARAFNRMLGRIQTLIRQMKEMTDNIAHDLRSPITRIRGIAETTLMSSESKADYESMAGSVVEECDRLLGMINTMLDISEAEAGVAQMEMVDIDISQVVKDACEIFRPIAENSHVQIVEHLSPRSYVHGDMLKIQRAISNILDNALKYTPAGGTVTVSVDRDNSHIMVSIKDTGIGISDSDLPRVFDRFFRGDASRSHSGTGLGLTLARAFVRAHGGEIQVETFPNKGTIFTMILKRSV